MAKVVENGGGEGEEIRVLLNPNEPANIKASSSTQTDLDLKSSIWNTFHRDIKITWTGLRYEIKPTLWQKYFEGQKQPKVVFDNLCGSVSSGQLSAIMGPSGAGKTCLLGCISCQRSKGVSGDLRVAGTNSIKLAIIPQDDQLLPEFTVLETLKYASRLKNNDFIGFNHQRIIDSVIGSLKLSSCVDIAVKQISGGERRRLSIGTELVSKPDALVLDEPTSGLDSTTALLLIQLLKQLATQQSMIIALTIHQPSTKVFNIFDKVYILASKGECIYEGPPADISEALSVARLELPARTNPADFILDVANEDFGREPIEKMALYHDDHLETQQLPKFNGALFDDTAGVSLQKLVFNERKDRKFPIINHVYLLGMRSFLKMVRDPWMLMLMFGTAIVIPFLFWALFGEEIGHISGCPPFVPDVLSLSFEQVQHMISQKERLAYEGKKLFENYVFLFFIMTLAMFSSLMSAILSFPLEMKVARKEWHNGWFNCFSYYLGHSLAELPMVFASMAILVFLALWLTDQDVEFWRMAVVYAICLFLSVICQSIGVFFGILFADNVAAATYIAPVSQVPFVLFSGFFLQLDQIKDTLKPLAYMSYYRPVFYGSITAMYGFDRCECPDDGLQGLTSEELAGAMVGSEMRSIEDERASKAKWIYFLANYFNLTGPDSDSSGIVILKTLIKGTLVGGHDQSLSSQVSCDEFRSIPMKYYDLDDDFLYETFAILGGVVILFKIVNYFTLYFKIKQSCA